MIYIVATLISLSANASFIQLNLKCHGTMTTSHGLTAQIYEETIDNEISRLSLNFESGPRGEFSYSLIGIPMGTEIIQISDEGLFFFKKNNSPELPLEARILVGAQVNSIRGVIKTKLPLLEVLTELENGNSATFLIETIIPTPIRHRRKLNLKCANIE